MAQALSDLVIYTASVKFVSFSHSRDSQNCYENTSFGENKARKLAKLSGEVTFIEMNIYGEGAGIHHLFDETSIFT